MGQQASSKCCKMDSTAFDEEKIQTRLRENFECLKRSEFHPSPTDSQSYCCKMHSPIPDQYWLDAAWGEHFDNSLKTGILYHPAIVSELLGEVENVFNQDYR